MSVRRKEVSIKKVKDKQSFSPCHSDVEMELLLLFAYVLSHGCEWGVKRARKRVSSFDPHKVHTHTNGESDLGGGFVAGSICESRNYLAAIPTPAIVWLLLRHKQKE